MPICTLDNACRHYGSGETWSNRRQPLFGHRKRRVYRTLVHRIRAPALNLIGLLDKPTSGTVPSKNVTIIFQITRLTKASTESMGSSSNLSISSLYCLHWKMELSLKLSASNPKVAREKRQASFWLPWDLESYCIVDPTSSRADNSSV